jgi:hypothetical protein
MIVCSDGEIEDDEEEFKYSFTRFFSVSFNSIFACDISPLVFLVAFDASVSRFLTPVFNLVPASDVSNIVNKLGPNADSYRLLKGNLIVMIVSFFGSNGWPPGGIPEGNDCPKGLKEPGTDPAGPVATLA